MIVVFNSHTHYDWEVLPPHIEPTEEDIARKIVKPTPHGWSARVKRKIPIQTTVTFSELTIIGQMIHGIVKEKTIWKRREAIAQHIRRMVLEHHAHPSWLTSFEVTESGSDPALFEKVVDDHIRARNIAESDREALIAAYNEPVTADDHVTHLHAHFGVKKKDGEEKAPPLKNALRKTEGT